MEIWNFFFENQGNSFNILARKWKDKLLHLNTKKSQIGITKVVDRTRKVGWDQPFFCWKAKLNIKKLKNEVNLKVFQSAKVREKISKNHQIFIFGFQCVTKNIEGWLKFHTSNTVYSQIWLNIPRDDRQFFYIFLILTLSKSKKS